MTRIEACHNEKLLKWSGIIKECRESGFSVTEWCEKHNVDRTNFYRWERKINQEQEDEVTGFEEVNLKAVNYMPKNRMKNSSTHAVIATLRFGSVNLDIYSGADSVTLENLLKGLHLC